MRDLPDGKVELRFSVVDTGVGMQENDLAQLFQDYFQADNQQGALLKGTGLGLTISKSLVTILGGKVGVKSEWQKGSEFWFTLDVEKAEVEVPVKKDKEVGKFTGKILLVDDKKVNITVASLMLKKMGLNVDVAENGKEAVEKSEKDRFDLIFMDIQMPIMNGVEATKIIKSNTTPPVIVGLSANNLEGDREKYLSLGFDDYLPKPLTLTSLSKLLEKWIK